LPRNEIKTADSSLDVKEVRLSDILLNSNEPDFKMFFEFGCHEVDSIFTMVCYDWDPQQPVVRAGEEVRAPAVAHSVSLSISLYVVASTAWGWAPRRRGAVVSWL
jgi:hypothetical protein